MKYAYIERHSILPRWEAWTWTQHRLYALTIMSDVHQERLKHRVEKLGFLVRIIDR